eukprot:1050383-Prymnesium_polylepis.1
MLPAGGTQSAASITTWKRPPNCFSTRRTCKRSRRRIQAQSGQSKRVCAGSEWLQQASACGLIRRARARRGRAVVPEQQLAAIGTAHARARDARNARNAARGLRATQRASASLQEKSSSSTSLTSICHPRIKPKAQRGECPPRLSVGNAPQG